MQIPVTVRTSKKTPSRSASKGSRNSCLHSAAVGTELGGGDDEDAEPCDRGDPGALVKGYIRHLSFDKAEEDNSQYLEVRSHASLDKITELDGKRYRSDASLQWLKKFIYEMKSTRMPQNYWCEPFSLSLGRAAKSCEAFLDYYCSQFDQSARTRHYSARHKENEPICDFLVRLNGYARAAKIQYENGGADAGDHVENFLLHCGDGDVMVLVYPLPLDDISKVEQVINRRILGEKRKKQCDRLVTMRSRYVKRKEQSRRAEPHREDRRDGNRDDRRDDRRNHKQDSRQRRVTVAEANSEEEESNRRPPSSYDSEGDWSLEVQSSEDDSAYGSDYMDTGFVSDKSKNTGRRESSARGRDDSSRDRTNSANRPSRPFDRRDQSNRRDGSRDRPP
ncbi:hypothetical protein PC112_g13991 [Phytophthora cactorum]|nr:hypothetical protein PC112_g13991 [Phytophthora cactorum]